LARHRGGLAGLPGLGLAPNLDANGHPRGKRGSLNFLFGNITEWGPKFMDFVSNIPGCKDDAIDRSMGASSIGWDLMGVAEHHLSLKDLRGAAKKVANKGWRLIGVPARAGPSSGTSGGVLILSRAHLAVWPTLRSPCVCSGPQPVLGHGHDWIACEVHLRKGVLTLVVLYLTNSLGMKGCNLGKAAEISRFARGLKGPLAIVGDWNMTPSEVMASGFLAAMGKQNSMRLLQPPTAFTCTSGKGRVYDYWAANQQAEALMIEPWPVLACPWKVHKGIGMTFSCAPGSIKVQKLVRPKDLRHLLPHDRDCSVKECSWEQASVQADLARRPCDWSPVVAKLEGAPLLANAIQVPVSQRLAIDLQHFGETFDVWACSKAGVSPDVAHQYSGSLQAPRFQMRRLVAQGHDIVANQWIRKHVNWAAISASLAEAETALREHHVGESLSLPRCLALWLWAEVDEERDPWDKSLLLTISLRLTAGGFATMQQVQSLQVDVTKGQLAAEAQARRQQGKLAQVWADNALQGSSAAAFAFVKNEGQADEGTKCHDQPPVTAGAMAQVTFDPNLAMQARCATWARQWEAQQLDADRLRAVVAELTTKAREELPDLPQVSSADVAKHSGKVRASTALGADFISPALLKGMPEAGLCQLARLFGNWTAELTMPLQAMINLMAVIPKPDGGERLVAMMSMVTRVFFRSMRWRIGEWEAARAGFWDDAIAGSSALRAAVMRSYRMEVCGLLGASASMAFIDIEKFYDSLDPVLLIMHLLALDFPAVSLLLHLQVHWAVRIVIHRGVVSNLMVVSRSILAGCTSSNSIARGYLYHICERLHWQFPAIRLGTFVDDIVLDLQGSQRSVSAGMASAVECVVELIEAAKLTVSSKSVVVGSTMAIATDVVRRLAANGITMVKARAAKDLGVGSTAGRRRTAAVLKARRGKAVGKAARAKVISKLVKSKGQLRGRRLWTQSVEPTMLYGATVAGLGQRSLQGVRTLAVNALGCSTSQQCVTSTLALSIGCYMDPAVKVKVSIIYQWMEILFSKAFIPRAAEAAWTKAVVRLGAASKLWSSVSGPLQATIATLLELQWQPVGPTRWRDSSGSLWVLSDLAGECSTRNCDTILRAVRHDALKLVWQRALGHRGSSGLAGIPDVSLPRKLKKLFVEQGQFAHAGMLAKVFAGGLWPRDRWADEELKKMVKQASGLNAQACPKQGRAALVVDRSCFLCGHEPQDEWHTAWGCPHVLAMPEMIALGDYGLCQAAIMQRGGNIALWTRGLNGGIYDDVPSAPEDPISYLWPCPQWPPGRYFTDASGGPNSDDPILRRVAGAALAIDVELFDGAGNFAPNITHFLETSLPGDAQTINRGELYLIIRLLALVVPAEGEWTTVVTDSQYCVDGYERGQTASLVAWNADLWTLYYEQAARHANRIHLIKVKSHLKLRDAVLGGVLLYDLVGNELVDFAAGNMASEVAISSSIVDCISQAKGRTMNILKHNVQANICYLEARKAKLVEQGLPVTRPRGKKRLAPNPTPPAHELAQAGGRWKCSLCQVSRATSLPSSWKIPCRSFVLQLWGSQPNSSGIDEVLPEELPKDEQYNCGGHGSSGALMRPLDSAALTIDPLDDPEGELLDESPDEFSEQPRDSLEGDREGFDDDSNEEHSIATRSMKRVRLTGKQPCPVYDDAIRSAVARARTPSVPARPGTAWALMHNFWGVQAPTSLLLSDGRIRFGGVGIHPTHLLALHHVSGASLVYCPTCMGTSAGAHASLLHSPCRGFMSRTQKVARKRLWEGLWPTTTLQRQYDPTGAGHRSVRFSVFSFTRLRCEAGFVSVHVQQLTACV
jgi:ribonuclease HI